VRLRHKDGHFVWVHERGQAVWDEKGVPQRMAGSIVDISDRKLAEEEVRRYEVIVAGSSDMLALLDDKYTYLAVNKAYLDAFGKTRREVIGRQISEILGEDLFEKSIKPNADRLMDGGEVHYQDWFDFPGTGKIFLDVRYNPFVDAAGKVKGFAVSGRDITENANAHAELKTNEERFHSAFDAVITDNVIMSEMGRIESFNLAATKMFGYAPNEVIGENVKMLMPEPYQNEHDGYLAHHQQTGEKKIIGAGGREVEGLRKNGEVFPMHLGVGETMIGDKRSYIGSITDLSEIKGLERQLLHAHRMDAVGKLTGGVAHDFNNLLTIISSNAEFLMDGIDDADEDARQVLNAIQQAASRGASLTNRLLAFSRQQTLSPEPTDLALLVGGLYDMLRRTLGEKIDLRIEVDDSL